MSKTKLTFKQAWEYKWYFLLALGLGFLLGIAAGLA